MQMSQNYEWIYTTSWTFLEGTLLKQETKILRAIRRIKSIHNKATSLKPTYSQIDMPGSILHKQFFAEKSSFGNFSEMAPRILKFYYSIKQNNSALMKD